MITTTKKISFLLVILLSFSNALFAQGYRLSDQAKISVITCGSGDQLYSIFGHTAIRVADEAIDLDIIYNYGTFDFNTPNFYLKFVKGDLDYVLTTATFEQFIYEYQQGNRDVFEQELALSPAQKQELFELLTKNVYSEERFYRYKFIDKNCTTMAVDKVNRVIPSYTIEKNKPYEKSYRHVLNPYLDNLFYEKLGINIIFGHRPDTEAKQLFLPNEFFESLATAKPNNNSLVSNTITHNLQDKSKIETTWWNTPYTLLFGLLLVIFSNNKKVYTTYLITVGVLGIFLLLVGLYSLHREVLWNYNALLFNPLYLSLVAYFWQKKATKFKRVWLLSLVLLLIYTIYLAFKAHFLLLVPFIGTHAILLYRLNKWFSPNPEPIND
ncbi:lipoprotein N-acyltransferase Lnb domain-containing protein [Flavobacterium orientale]|uniref:DUF4105 domain-containing protein n=1 Tax=Flavobacterium orientale TaxID=1756020 RepID=A0A917D9W7_9FLAO|nr:DUF4105 domain-containing protein [Flavobacterium orientale]GGD15165.1 hypothetical protein GCM10011343_02660 [Flavobacterium orientale]